MSDWEYEITAILPVVIEKDRPVLYLADGRQVVVRKPVGFAGHPEVPTQKIKRPAR